MPKVHPALWVNPVAIRIRPAMPDRIRHAMKVGTFTGADKAGYSAHASTGFNWGSEVTLRVARTR